MDTARIKNSAKDYILDDISEIEVSASKKSRYAAAIDESDIDADIASDDFSDLDIEDDDLHSIYNDQH
ncbi:MAG TPA: hypothetical protein VGJ90_09480 [Methylophilaceae bacterium]|jgi:hypothetical protein